jgi:hypothetical protein
MEPIFHIDNNFQFSEQRIIEKSGYVQERFFMKKINFEITITLINSLLSRKCPETFNSSWILKHAPACYYFIRKNIRTEMGTIDWDRITRALEVKHQRRWVPKRQPAKGKTYYNRNEVDAVLNSYQDKLYVFVVSNNRTDKRTWDIISIRLVRLAQRGNISAEQEVIKLVRYTVDEWLDQSSHLSRWKGYDDEIQKHIEGCIYRYRYTGSFFNYVYRTLEYAARGIRPFYLYSLDEPLMNETNKRWIEAVIKDPESGDIGLCRDTFSTSCF